MPYRWGLHTPPPPNSLLMTVSESPSKWDCCNPISFAKITTRLAASASRHSLECGLIIFSTIAATTNPPESRTTMPKPASSLSLNNAPSKLTLYSPGLGGIQLHRLYFLLLTSGSRQDWNSCRKFCTASLIPLSGVVFSFSLDLFLCAHTNQVVVAKSSHTLGFDRTFSTKSWNEPCATSNLFTQLKSRSHTCLIAS